MVDDDDARFGFADALGLGDEAVRIAHDADDMADEDVVEGVVAEGKLKGVGLEELGGGTIAVKEFFAALTEHAGGEVDPDDLCVGGVMFERGTGADAEVEDGLTRGDVHVGDTTGDPALDEPAERNVIEHRMEIVDISGAGFLHGHERLLLRLLRWDSN